MRPPDSLATLSQACLLTGAGTHVVLHYAAPFPLIAVRWSSYSRRVLGCSWSSSTKGISSGHYPISASGSDPKSTTGTC